MILDFNNKNSPMHRYVSNKNHMVRNNKIINHKLFKFVIKKRFVASFDTFLEHEGEKKSHKTVTIMIGKRFKFQHIKSINIFLDHRHN